MIRTVLFDMGNVLLHFSHERMCAQIGRLCGKTGDEIRELLFGRGLQSQFERGLLSAAEFHEEFERAVGTGVDMEELAHAGSDIFELNRPMPDILDELKAQGRRLVLLSNTSVAHFEFVRSHFDVLERFDDLVLSFEVRATKPAPAIYEAALERIGCRPEQCFYTDDVPEYVATARRFGLDAEVFTDANTLISHLADRDVVVAQA